jgi:hypothetical protein
MAGTEHLGQQFMPITQLMNMRSHEYGLSVGEVFNHIYNSRKEGEPLNPTRPNGATYKWDTMRQHLGQQGIKNPLLIRPPKGRVLGESPTGVLMNGHHRAMTAIEQGHLFVPVKTKPTAEDFSTEYLGDE